MPVTPRPPDHGSVLAEVRRVRRAGLLRLRELETPELIRIARELPSASPSPTDSGAVERLLRTAVSAVGGGSLQEAAEFTLGLAQGTRDWPASSRRRRAAQVYGVSVERFRKHHELMVLGQVAERIVDIAAPPAPAPAPAPGLAPAPRQPFPGAGAEAEAAWGAVAAARPRAEVPPVRGGLTLPPAHRTVPVHLAHRTVPVTVHVHSVDLLRDVDVVLSPSNTYFSLPAAYKSSVAATLRRAGARRDASGGLVEDRVHDELAGWAERHAAPGREALPGTVAATSAGALAEQGIRRIYHVAVAVPRPGTNDYDVQPADLTRGVARALALLAAENARAEPPLTSVCLPLLGAGRGGLSPLESFSALWAAVEAELVRGAELDVHFVVRRHARADLVERLLVGLGGDTPGPRAGRRREAGEEP
ncbi:hypothetical protein [Streptomyces flavofungini]|uniref:hypothetical protein n=1 Tax=Streptomyces flavofungini TaxID=68200 RepID=UPI0025B02CA5|nr:hypothetical protein [Streptomyces flavofungini]WJV46499.1 hypothetical protein QUY26_13750 [Streptomyces flavofungini]